MCVSSRQRLAGTTRGKHGHGFDDSVSDWLLQNFHSLSLVDTNFVKILKVESHCSFKCQITPNKRIIPLKNLTLLKRNNVSVNLTIL